ncbi:putative oxidoreductase [Mobilisporobacter senegalensis]|uniref:Putative oxidoreductase n=1 Tax=Mobilisporobacter senegalensis TaxID=1329262 RepID=A0A3N1XKA0_9FIRM|nr:aldo/keto reductase [Mobilisporobacter senegalensis]ROR27144.1 putative oxidoreductase [Mobilisporobacter senegalensis]
MRQMKVNNELLIPQIVIGCMRMNSVSLEKAEELIQTALDLDINFFDHADIYGKGECEEIFAKAIGMNPSIREKIILQSKCGIRKGFFDFSKEHILNSVDGILKRLNTEYLDILLLHRPDTLVEPEEVGDAFHQLKKSGKVKYFGVSNQKPMQIELLQKYVDEKLMFNQLQLSITNSTMIQSGINVNMENESALDRDGSVLDYCRLKDITIQAWSPFQYGFFEGVFLDNDKFPELNGKINEIAAKYNVSNSAIAVAWIMRHPANIQTILGTMNPERLKDICKACEVTLSREEWYEIYRSAGNILP